MADPGFPVGGHGPIRGDVDPQCGCFPMKMCAKTKEFGPVGGCARHAPTRSANAHVSVREIYILYFAGIDERSSNMRVIRTWQGSDMAGLGNDSLGTFLLLALNDQTQLDQNSPHLYTAVRHITSAFNTVKSNGGRIQDFPLSGALTPLGAPTSRTGAFWRKQKNYVRLGDISGPHKKYLGTFMHKYVNTHLQRFLKKGVGNYILAVDWTRYVPPGYPADAAMDPETVPMTNSEARVYTTGQCQIMRYQ